MPTITTIQPYLPVKESLVQPSTGVLTPVGLAWFQAQAGNIAAMAASLNLVLGVNVATVATQPTLAVGDAGYLLFLTDYEHTLRWTGTTWKFFGTANGYFTDLPFAPQSGAWQLCDGTVVKYLTLGATLTETSFTTPNLIATPAYRKAAAAYTGTINPASGVTGTGTTGTGTTGTGTTGTGTTGTGTTGTGTTGTPSNATTDAMARNDAIYSVHVVVTSEVSGQHTHSVPGLSVPGLSVPGLSVPGLSVPGLSVPTLGVGTLDMANLGCLPYFRR